MCVAGLWPLLSPRELLVEDVDTACLGSREPVQAFEQGEGGGPRPQVRCPAGDSGRGSWSAPVCMGLGQVSKE